MPVLIGNTGVCITGEARYLAIERVQRHLQAFLDALQPRVVHYDMARVGSASCSGFQMQFFPSECRKLKAMSFIGGGVPSLPNRTTVSFVERSSCAGRGLSQHPCCNVPGLKFEPGALLQYLTAQACIDSLFDRYPNITHVIRTRPDVMYRRPVNTASTLNRFIASYASRTLCRDKYDGQRTSPTYSDIFVLIGRRDRSWFSDALLQMKEACKHGQSVSRFPENYPHGSCHIVKQLDVNKIGVAGDHP